MTTLKRLFVLLIPAMGCIFLSIGCSEEKAARQLDSASIIEEVKIQVTAFHAADTALNAEAVVALLWPEFTMLADGNFVDYGDVASASKAFMATLEVFHTQWEGLKVIPLDNRHAISTFTFIDSLVAKDGTITRSRGPNTFVWEKRDGIWKVIHADADHYPVK